MEYLNAAVDYSEFYLNGTFKCKPPNYKQLYVRRIKINKDWIDKEIFAALLIKKDFDT